MQKRYGCVVSLLELDTLVFKRDIYKLTSPNGQLIFLFFFLIFHELALVTDERKFYKMEASRLRLKKSRMVCVKCAHMQA